MPSRTSLERKCESQNVCEHDAKFNQQLEYFNQPSFCARVVHFAVLNLIAKISEPKGILSFKIKVMARNFDAIAHSHAKDTITDDAAPPESFQDRAPLRPRSNDFVVMGFGIFSLLDSNVKPGGAGIPLDTGRK